MCKGAGGEEFCRPIALTGGGRHRHDRMRTPSFARILGLRGLSCRGPWLAPLALALAGCGHPATRAECDELFAKSAEIELRGQRIDDPARIVEMTAAARATPKGAEFTTQCAGKRITDRALACVRKATTAQEFDR